MCHQSIPAAPRPSPPPGLLWGICTPCQSQGWDICKFYAAWGPGICQRQGQPRPFDMHTVSYQDITTQRILLEKQADRLAHLSRMGKNWRGLKKKSHIKTLKMELLDCAINEKCCSVDGGRSICPRFFPTPGDLTAQESPPWEFECPGVSLGGGGGGVRVLLAAAGIDWWITFSHRG